MAAVRLMKSYVVCKTAVFILLSLHLFWTIVVGGKAHRTVVFWWNSGYLV